jgi:hypothetical protein
MDVIFKDAISQEIHAASALSPLTGITATLPKPMTSGVKAEGRFGKQDFVYIVAQNAYRCPAGERLTYRFTTSSCAIHAALDICPMTPAIGAEIRGVRLSCDLPDKTVTAIGDALLLGRVVWRRPCAGAGRRAMW